VTLVFKEATKAQRHQVAQIYLSHLVTLRVFVSLWQILSSFYPDNGEKNEKLNS
jgi:hypothetical protein